MRIIEISELDQKSIGLFWFGPSDVVNIRVIGKGDPKDNVGVPFLSGVSRTVHVHKDPELNSEYRGWAVIDNIFNGVWTNQRHYMRVAIVDVSGIDMLALYKQDINQPVFLVSALWLLHWRFRPNKRVETYPFFCHPKHDMFKTLDEMRNGRLSAQFPDGECHWMDFDMLFVYGAGMPGGMLQNSGLLPFQQANARELWRVETVTVHVLSKFKMLVNSTLQNLDGDRKHILALGKNGPVSNRWGTAFKPSITSDHYTHIYRSTAGGAYDPAKPSRNYSTDDDTTVFDDAGNWLRQQVDIVIEHVRKMIVDIVTKTFKNAMNKIKEIVGRLDAEYVIYAIGLYANVVRYGYVPGVISFVIEMALYRVVRALITAGAK